MALHPAPWPAAMRADVDDGTARHAMPPERRPVVDSGTGEPDGSEFDDLVCMASQLLGAPIALIAVAEGENFRMVAERGYGKPLVPREHAICRAVDHDTPQLFVADAAADARFRDDPAVACAEGVRFYLGVALFGSTGLQLGVLAVADTAPREAVPADAVAMLRRLARLAARLVERRAFERSNRIAEQIARADFSAVVVVDAARAVTFANAAAQAVFGASVDAGQPVDALFPAALQVDPDAVELWLGANPLDEEGAGATRELRVRSADGELRTLEAVRCAWLTGDGGAASATDGSAVFALILRDITERRRLQQRRRRADQQDPLTGLPNRATLLTTLDGLRARTASLGVALLGLNNFRAVNDTLGHAIGDAVLQVVACRLLARLPAQAHLARFDGDEFVLVFADTAVDTIEALLGTMLRELARPCEIDQQRVHLEASIGLAMSGTEDDAREDPERVDARELVARAGLAMQHAKRANGQQLRRFRPDMRAAAIDRRLLDLELRRASREGEFELHYQPQIDLATGLPTGAEALLRWRHPERGLLLPIDFIDALAHSAVALTVGRWVLQQACRDAAAWPEVAGRRLAVGVNLFPAQFDDEHLLDEVDHALALSGLPPAQLELELTETIALNDDGVAEHVLVQLRARGIRVAYDDFGTGFASLSMLQRLPVDRVKIDRSFVRNVMENRGDEAIVRSIALIARNFDLEVIAEGVETPFQAEFLRELGCQDVQGWLYSKALAPLDFDRWLAVHANAPPAKASVDG